MGNKGFSVLLLGFLSFFILSTFAVPSSRSLIINPHKQGLSTEFLLLQEIGEGEGERRRKGRVDMEVNDYPGTGANPGHDPNVPGGSG
ncbi:hypothetical protein RND81_06G196100 [Saponaria officinalis]|uniref:Transmembrane protein n=1 Tax=Saponaria officinalis TaxID=3572 RepID=A0AAW1KEY0_SAPOF